MPVQRVGLHCYRMVTVLKQPQHIAVCKENQADGPLQNEKPKVKGTGQYQSNMEYKQIQGLSLNE